MVDTREAVGLEVVRARGVTHAASLEFYGTHAVDQ